MRSIEPLASNVPYMVCPGNHEELANFSHYDSRFSMLSSNGEELNYKAPLNERMNNHFYSINIGPVHIVLFSTEYYYYTNYGWEQIERQFNWLEKDLKRANENRDKQPWIIGMGHRPLYCLTMGDHSCNYEKLERINIRQGIEYKNLTGRKFGLEKLFYKHGVDLLFYGHEHFYARFLPMFNYQIKNGNKSTTNPYDHPNGPIHITTGSAGNWEFHPPFNANIPEWVGRHFLDFGFTRLTLIDKYHIRLEQISVDQVNDFELAY